VSAKKRAPHPGYLLQPRSFISKNSRENPLWAVDKSCEVEKRAGKWTLWVHRFWEIYLPYPCILQYETPLMRSGGPSIGIPA
jgi:hypothetical protein